MATKTISQKRFAKLVASTGPVSQPPGAIPRMSNMVFTTRGSLQIADGSASIGQLPSPFLSPLAMAAYTKYASGNYPLYAAIASSDAYIMPNATGFSATGSGSVTNPVGFYTFVIIANGVYGGTAINTGPTQTGLVAAQTFSTVTFQWNPVANATTYDIYYITSTGAIVGNKIIAGTTGTLSGGVLTASFTGMLSSGSTAIPQTNTSYLFQLIIGSVTPPIKTVIFTPVASGPILGTPPLAAQLMPGDPSFVFDPITSSQQTLYPASAGASQSETANSSNPSQTYTTTAASGWSSSPVASGQQVTLYVPISGYITYTGALSGYGLVVYQYSEDGGSTWNNIASFGGTIGDFNWNQTNSVSFTPADVSDIQVRMTVSAYWYYGSGASVTASGNVGSGVYVTTSVQTSFSPYGGIPGQACPIPQLVQFAGLEIIALGNGYAPQSTDPTALASATLTALSNTFQDAFPSWQASVDWITGAQVTDGAGNFYTATQGGVSGTSAPSWNTAMGAQTSDGTVVWTSEGPIVASTAPRGAAHAVAYAGSLWLANTYPTNTSDGIDGPSCLKMSDSNNPNSWNPVNTAFIGRSDGSQITGLQPFTIAALGISPTGSLCVFKEFQTYQVIGVFGSTSFEIQPAQTNLGCIAARSIQFLPGFGVVRYSHLGFAVFDGINDRLISEDIRPYLFGGVASEADLVPVDPSYCYLAQSAQTKTPPMYLCAMPLVGGSGALTRIFCYDLVMKAWTILDLPWAISSLSTMSGGEGYPLVLAGRVNGSIQRIQSGDVLWDSGASDQSDVNWSFRTPDVFGEGASQRMFFQQAVINGYGNPAMVQGIVAQLWLDGKNLGTQGIDIVPMGGSNVFQINVKLFVNGQRAHLDISGDGGGTGTIDSIDWSVVPKSATARRVIS